MSFTEEQTPTKKGIGRRDLIKKGAVAGAIIWAVPMIESVPAYAATGSNISSACSYFVLVYTFDGVTYADRVTSSGSCGGNTTSHDVKWCWICGTNDQYDNLGPSDAIRHTTLVLGVPTTTTVLGGSGCASGTHFNVSGNTITANAGVTILFAVAHAGSLDGTTGTDPGTPTGTALLPGVCGVGVAQDKVNVACAPISTATFDCLAP
jgi:hypothetical protein